MNPLEYVGERKGSLKMKKYKTTETHRELKEVQKFYRRTKEIRKGYQPSADLCKNAEGNLIGDTEKAEMLKLGSNIIVQ